jgi:hypothetical protein
VQLSEGKLRFVVAADETSDWYLRENNNSVGPMTVQELKARLRASADWRSMYVWREGLEDWVQAASIPELHQVGPPPFKQTSARKSTSRRIVGAGAFVLAIVVGVLAKEVVKAGLPSNPLAKPIPVDELLAAAAAQQKPKLPVRLDEETTLVDIAADGKILTYSYKVSLDKIDVDLLELKKTLLNRVCQNVRLKTTLGMAATLRFRYADQKSSPIGVIDITRSDCG